LNYGGSGHGGQVSIELWGHFSLILSHIFFFDND